MSPTKKTFRHRIISKSSGANQGLIIWVIILFFVGGLFLGKYFSKTPNYTVSNTQQNDQIILPPADNQPNQAIPIGTPISQLSGNIAPSLSINNATSFSHILTTPQWQQYAVKSKKIDLNNIQNPILISSGIVRDISPDGLPVIEVFDAKSLAPEEEQPKLNIIPFTGAWFQLNFGTNTGFNAKLNNGILIITLSGEEKFKWYLKECKEFGMSCQQLHQTFKNISPPITNQYGIDFFRYAETTGSWIVIFPNKFMNMFGSEDYIKSYFNYFEPITENTQPTSKPTNNTQSTTNNDSPSQPQVQPDTPNLDDLNSYTFRAWFTVYFPKTAAYQMLLNEWETLTDCKYVINTIYYKNSDELQSNPDLQIFVCDNQPSVPDGGKLLQAQDKYFVVIPLTAQGQQWKDLIYVK